MSTHGVSFQFQAFFEGWLLRLQAFLHQLRLAADNSGATHRHHILIHQVISHYHQLYEEKARGAHDDVLLFLSPPWLSFLERSLLWIGGDKPSLIVKLAVNNAELTEEQGRRLERVGAAVRRAERKLTEEMAVIQESLEAPPLLGLARRFGSLVDGEVSDLDSAMELIKVMMLDALEGADALRGSTLTMIVEILSPVQTVRFLVVAAEFLLRIRAWGLQRDSLRETETA